MSLETVPVVVGAVLTFMILSYLIGDNFLFRLAVHILIGAGAAYAVVTVVAALIDRVVQLNLSPNREGVIVAVVGLVLGGLLLFKASPRVAWLGNISVGYLVGVGAAVALGGALFGTLGPQIVATASPAGGLTFGPDESIIMNFMLNLFVLVGTVVTLLSFGYYRAAHGGILSGVNTVGRRFFLMVAFGATFALVFIASATLLIGRLEAIVQGWSVLFPGK
jgi:hypothetical protein